MITTYPSDGLHPNVRTLKAIYADLSSIGEYTVDDVVLHRANRTVDDPHPVMGRDNVVAHEVGLVAMTGNTLVMDVAHIAANDHFGAVLGTLRVQHPAPATMPFCGLWRFENGRVLEHWENAYDATAFMEVLTQFAGAS